jgi:hypothetical protein
MKNVMPQPIHDNGLFETLCILLVITNKQIDHTHVVFILHTKNYDWMTRRGIQHSFVGLVLVVLC